MKKESILLISPNLYVAELLNKILRQSIEFTVISDLHSAFDRIYDSIPNLLIMDLQRKTVDIEILNSLKKDPLFAHLPILAILGEGDSLPDWNTLLVEDYLWYRDMESDAFARIALCLSRADRMVEVNPLTRLPGNISINRQIQSRLDMGVAFALAYADLDHFKPFNDKYGFSRGDQVIKITGRLLLNIVRNIAPYDSFIGHIGGDDFVCIMGSQLIEKTCQDVIGAFDKIVPSFYDPQDREAGSIRSYSREGQERQYPIMSISIGIVHVEKGIFSHYGEVTSVATEMKHVAKKKIKSSYAVNRRGPASPP